MEKASEILSELQIISPHLAGIENVNVFQVPEHYFDELPAKILTTIFLHQDGTNNNDQQVPDGYFDELSNKILLKIKNADVESAEEETRNISPVLFSLKDKNVFKVPRGYFENLGNSIHTKLNSGKAKVIPFSSGKKRWKYAAAAVIAGGITFGTFQVFNNKSVNNGANKVLTASVNIPDYIKLSFQYKTPEQLDEGIESLSDDEIAAYLVNHGSMMDDDTLAKDIDPNDLPSTEDYLMNDSTLSDFLNTIDTPDSNTNTQ